MFGSHVLTLFANPQSCAGGFLHFGGMSFAVVTLWVIIEIRFEALILI